MELCHSSCKCNTDGNYVQSCCFNPVIFFICKLCRRTFENAEKLILHKRQHHSLKDLKGIKFIVFEERFVETDDNTSRKELTSTVAPLSCEIANNSIDINSVSPLHQDDSPGDPDINNVIDIIDESNELKFPNPFVQLRRLTSKEVNSYSRPTAATHQNQETEDVGVIDHDKRCDSTAKQKISCDKTTTTSDEDRSINTCSYSKSNENVSGDLTESQISRIVQNFEIIHFPKTRSSLCKKLKNKQLELDGRSAAKMDEIPENSKKISFSSHSTIAFDNDHPASEGVSNLQLQAKTRTGSSPEQSKISDADIQNNCMETQTFGGNQSHHLTYERNPSAELVTINENGNDDSGPEIISDGEFIVANVVQSSDGIGIQFVSACASVNAEKKSTARKLNLNEALEKQHPCKDIDPLETEKASEFDSSDSFSIIPEVVSDDAGGPPSTMPVPLEVVPSLTEAQIKTEDQAVGKISNSEVATLPVKVDTPEFSVSPQTEREILVRVSPQSTARSRPLRNRSKINYSENQTCAKCSRDFYTVEELETHEKLCLKNKTNRKREQVPKQGLKLMSISDGAKTTHSDINDNDEIQVIQAVAISPNHNDPEVKVTDSEGDQNYDFPDVISSSSQGRTGSFWGPGKL